MLTLITVILGSSLVMADEVFTIGFSQMENNMPWRIAETESMKALSSDHPDVKVIITDAQGSVAKQVSDCEDLLARGIDILALAPRSA